MRLPQHLTLALLGIQAASALRKTEGASFAPPDEVMPDFWEGLDSGSTADQSRLQGAQKIYVRPSRQRVSKRRQNASTKKLALLGPFDAGTNLLLTTLETNHPGKVREACDQDCILIDDARTAHCRIWKHGLNISDAPGKTHGVEPLYELLSYRNKLQPEDVVVVIMVLNPLSQMISWHKAGYNLDPCTGLRSMADYDKPCHNVGMEWYGLGHHKELPVTRFASTMDIYNRYMRMYGAIQREGPYTAVLVTYEDLVYSPGDVVNRVAEVVGWPQLDSVAIIDAPAKQHGDPSGRERALEKLRAREWLQEIPSEEAKRAMCKGLDASALEGLVDNSYSSEEPSKSYVADCEGYF